MGRPRPWIGSLYILRKAPEFTKELEVCWFPFMECTRGRESERGRDAAGLPTCRPPVWGHFGSLFLLKSPSCAPFAPTKSKSYEKSVPWLQHMIFLRFFFQKRAPLGSVPCASASRKHSVFRHFHYFLQVAQEVPNGTQKSSKWEPWAPKVVQSGAK